MTIVSDARRALIAGLVLVAALLGMAVASQHQASATTFSKGGVSLSLNVNCTSNSTSATKTGGSGGRPGYAARFRESSTSTWKQGPEVSSGTSSVFGTTAKLPQHEVRVFWAGGAQNYGPLNC